MQLGNLKYSEDLKLIDTLRWNYVRSTFGYHELFPFLTLFSLGKICKFLPVS